MRALLSITPGGPGSLQLLDVDDPIAGPGEVLVCVKACAINYPDVLVIEDKYQFKPKRPFAPGGEIAGIVEAIGPGVTGWAPGDRIMALTRTGGLAEKVAVPAEKLFGLPDEFDFVRGAALLLTYATTIHALKDRGNLQRGDTLLVLGAAGGLGLAAVELGQALGARIVAAVSSKEKAAFVRSAGASEIILYGRGPFDRQQQRELAARFKEALGDSGADVAYDPVGGDYAEAALRAMAWGGRYLVAGFTAGIPKIPLNLALLKGCDIRGVFAGAYWARDPAGHRANVEQLLDFWRAGRISPQVSATYPLSEGGNAIAALANRDALGKLVVNLDAPQ